MKLRRAQAPLVRPDARQQQQEWTGRLLAVLLLLGLLLFPGLPGGAGAVWAAEDILPGQTSSLAENSAPASPPAHGAAGSVHADGGTSHSGAAKAAAEPAAATPLSGGAANPDAAERARIEALIKTLDNDKDRAALIDSLRLLLGKAPGADTEEDGLLPLLSARLETVSEQLLETLAGLADFGKTAQWSQTQLLDPQARQRWGDLIVKAGLVLGLAGLGEALLRWLLRRPRRVLEALTPQRTAIQLPLALGSLLLSLLPLAGFVLLANSLSGLPGLQPLAGGRKALLLLINAHLTSAAVVALVAALLQVRSPALRLLPLQDETAGYLAVWTRRLLSSSLWGYYSVQALLVLGLPASGGLILLKLLGLMIACLLLVLVMQNRQPVAAALSGATGEGALDGVRRRLADVWHILAVLYIIGVFGLWLVQARGGFELVLRASALTAVILLVAHLLGEGLTRLIGRLLQLDDETRSRFPALEARVNRYSPLLQGAGRVVIGLGVLLAVLQAWGIHSLSWLNGDIGRRLLASVLSVVAVLTIALILWEMLNAAIERYLHAVDADGNPVPRGARVRTLLPLLRNLVLVLLIVIVSLIVLSELGVNIAPLLAGAGVIGVAIGFGSQKLVQDFITGAFILFEDTVAIGDMVKIGEHNGVVEGLSIRTLRLRDSSGQLHTLPFSNVSTIVNMSRDFGYYILDVGVSYDTDPDRAMAVMADLGAQMQADPDWGPQLAGPLEILGLDRFADSAIVLRARLKAMPGRQWAVGREYNRRLKHRFDAEKISFPFPTHTVHLVGAEKDASGPGV